MKVKVNRFPELKKTIERSTKRVVVRSAVRMGVVDLGDEMLPVLREYSPAKTQETFMTTGHDHTTIYDGWSRPEVKMNHLGGVDMQILNRSEHIDVQRTGTEKRGYPIPFEPTGVTFWLGDPLKWGRRLPGGPGFVRFNRIKHPGFGPWGGKDFVEEAAESFENRWYSIVVGTVKHAVFREFNKFFGKRGSD